MRAPPAGRPARWRAPRAGPGGCGRGATGGSESSGRSAASGAGSGPGRGRCRSCGATHILLPAWSAPRRADAVGMIARAAAVSVLRGTAREWPGSRRGTGRPCRDRAGLDAPPPEASWPDAAGGHGRVRQLGQSRDQAPLVAAELPSRGVTAAPGGVGLSQALLDEEVVKLPDRDQYVESEVVSSRRGDSACPVAGSSGVARWRAT